MRYYFYLTPEGAPIRIKAKRKGSIKKLGVTCLSGVKCASQSVYPRWEDPS